MMTKHYSKKYTEINVKGNKVKLLILHPTMNVKPKEKTPGILWIHGGGYVSGSTKMIYRSRAMALVKKYGAVVITPEYRLAKDAPYPAALEDCYEALKYIKEHADELGINSSQLMVGGESAGGGLAAALCMYARDKDEVKIAYQMPIYPMIDNLDTDSSKDNNHIFVWNTKRNHRAWKAYLGDIWKLGDKVPPYAAAARQTDYSNLPPAYTFVGDIEPFYMETLSFIENLKNAGVEAKADVYPNCFHAFDLRMPFKKISRQAIDEFERRYLEACDKYYAPQK